MSETQASVFTGRARRKKTTLAVRLGDGLSRLLITAGGIGTIIAVFTVFAFLVWVVAPLFRSADLDPASALDSSKIQGDRVPRMALGEYGRLGWELRANGGIRAFQLSDGKTLDTTIPFSNRTVTATAFSLVDEGAALGFDDGAVAFGRIGFGTKFIDADEAPSAVADLEEGAALAVDTRLYERISPSQFRTRELRVEFAEPIEPESPAAITQLDFVDSGRERVYVAKTADGALGIFRLRQRKNLLTGKITYSRKSAALPLPEAESPPAFLLISGLGDTVYAAWRDGRLVRFNTRDLDAPFVQDQVDLIADPEVTLTQLQFLLGRVTLLAGDSAGNVSAWFPAHTQDPTGKPGGTTLVNAHTFPGEASVTTLASSGLMRMIAVGRADGGVTLRHVTSHKVLARLSMPGDDHPRRITFAPKDDGLAVLTDKEFLFWKMDTGHPEATLGALFSKRWYEGAPQPEHVWQSSSGTDDFEPKFGLIPLIFGTIKATVFSLLFGVPIALLAAIFTSEFLSPRAKSTIKPMVEMMASLPSVVLGFLAALVFAPIVADILEAFLAAFVTVPLAFLLGAYLWQLLPHGLSIRFQRWRFAAMCLALPAGLGFARLLGPGIERFCFAGDTIRWLDGQIGGATGGWFLILFPVAALTTAWASARWFTPRVRRWSTNWSRTRCALFDISRFGLQIAVALAAAWGAGAVLNAVGLDPRGGIFDTYVQRNALVVGFVMGFAVIPIIYTIAEDALSSVPDHLRSASLGAGATPWQTAIRIILPTAMSGLFSAVMIGLGRAVGETMIVLMAAGNTPLMEWNLFNGFRTLSANIAVELPEAVRNSTHYRTLFLAALALFVMTFILNSVAEVIRLRYRKKAFEL